MMIADAIGIFVGVVMCKNISGRKIKLVSAGAFILFGFIGSYQVAAGQLDFSSGMQILSMLVLAAVTGLSAYYLIKNDNTNQKEHDSSVLKSCKLREQNNEIL